MGPTAGIARTETRGPLRRHRSDGVLGGVCAGLARQAGVDTLVLRVAFVVAATAGGVGVVLYALAWVAIPADARDAAARAGRRTRTGRASLEVALGVGLLLLSALLGFRALGLWFSDAVVWPLVLVATGGALLWRQSLGVPTTPAESGPEPQTPPWAEPVSPPQRRAEASARPSPDEARQRAVGASRTSVGAALVIAAGVAFLQATGALSAARDVLLAALVVTVVLGVIFAPWIVALARSRSAERSGRIRSQERAEMAAHLHDSVLQTLALVQQQADDPRRVSALARQQERELRAWLSGGPAAGAAPARLAGALERAGADVERDHGAVVEVVVVGDRDLAEPHEALVAAAREAMVNAAKFGRHSPVAVYAEVSPERVEVFVRDRGPGFDPAAVPGDRRGVRESIVGRMERHGGAASIVPVPGGGTEVRLVLEAPDR